MTPEELLTEVRNSIFLLIGDLDQLLRDANAVLGNDSEEGYSTVVMHSVFDGILDTLEGVIGPELAAKRKIAHGARLLKGGDLEGAGAIFRDVLTSEFKAFNAGQGRPPGMIGVILVYPRKQLLGSYSLN